MNIFDDVTSKHQLLGQLAGAASTCWTNLSGAGEFDSNRAVELVEQALERLHELNQGA